MNLFEIFKKKSAKKAASYMESEIYEQPEILKKLAGKYITADDYILINIPLNVNKIKIIASGSSYQCAGLIAYLFNDRANINVSCEYSSEFILKELPSDCKDTFYIFISQSGQTSDTLTAIKRVNIAGAKTLCITNTEDSTLWNISDYKVFTHAGVEHSIASTKALSAQIFCLYLVMLKIMKAQNADIDAELKELKEVHAQIDLSPATAKKINTLSKMLAKFNDIAVLANGWQLCIAQEGALKIRETTYINVNTYPQGEFMHGHVAVLNNKAAVISIIDESNAAAAIKNLQKIKRDYNPLITTFSSGTGIPSSNFDLPLSGTNRISKMFNLLIHLQLLAFEMAKTLKRNIDNPKGLKKVVID